MRALSAAWRLAAGAFFALTLAALGGCTIMAPERPTQVTLPGQPFTPIDPYAQVAEMKGGVNVWVDELRPDEPPHAPFVPSRHFKIIRDGGFSTVRLVLATFDHMDGSLKLDAQYLARIDEFVTAALDAGLTVIVDEHDYGLCGMDLILCRAKLNAFWSQVAPRYRDMPNRLIFEMLNEPHQALTAEAWNKQLVETLAVIRASNPTRNVIIGPGNWNGIEFLPKLVLPADDRHIIATFHYYHPMEFTHQGAVWVPQFDKLGVTWGTKADHALLDRELDEVKAWSEANRRPMFLGEFGALETGALPDRLRYLDAVARAAETRGFSWAAWQLTGNFIVYDIDSDRWIEPVLHALIPPGSPPKPAP